MASARYPQLALAGRLVGATMHEVNNRVAALTNLIFLARALADLLGRASYMKEVDLVELATSALRLH